MKIELESALAKKISERQTDEFIRIEDKFLVPAVYEKNLRDIIRDHLKPAYVTENTQFTLVESIYFDSEGLDFFQNHFGKAEIRHKLRIRQYAPNGIWSQGVAFIEAKTKSRGVSTKERLSLDAQSHANLMHGGPLSIDEALREKNPGLGAKKVNERAERINELILKHKVSPHVSIQYKRLAYEADGLRVTIDRDVYCKTFRHINPVTACNIRQRPFWNKARNYATKFANDRAVIMEVKHLNGRPLWLEEFMGSVGVPTTGFSKYCWGISNLIEEIANA